MARTHLIEQMRTILLRRRDALRQALTGELAQFRTSESPAVGDPIDAVVDSEYAQINSELAEAEGRELAQIHRALQRISEGNYGVCEECGRKIPLARIQALPYATTCIACQTLREKTKAQDDSWDVEEKRERDFVWDGTEST